MSKDKLKALGSARVDYKDQYDPSQLERIERAPRREGYTTLMKGADIWTAYEVSFLLESGLPYFTVLRISNPADSKYIFESKSLKLYLNSFNNTVVKSPKKVLDTIAKDLSEVAEAEVIVEEIAQFRRGKGLYFNSDKLDYICTHAQASDYDYNPDLLKTIKGSKKIQFQFYTDLLRSNCEITNQPDWGRVFVKYEVDKLELVPESFLQYIVSYRNHQEFHEPTCERIFNDLYNALKPSKLLVICQYTRRGGIDINPARYTHENMIDRPLLDLPKILQQ